MFTNLNEWVENDINQLGLLSTVLNKKMEAFFATMFEDVRHERSLFLLVSLTDPDI